MAKPRVSILLTTFNRPRFIGESIQSSQRQTCADWELIIVDDSENDATEKAVVQFTKSDARIHYFHRLKKGTIANSSNFGLSKAQGEFVAILDDDDYWADDRKLEKQIVFLDKNPEYVGCGGGFIIVNEKGEKTGRVKKPETDGAIRRVALYANPIANSTSIFRRTVGGSYDETLSQFADWDYWLRLGMKGKLYNFPEYFLAYRMWGSGASFVYQKENVDMAFIIIRRYRKSYPGYFMALLGTSTYWCYARLPQFLQRRTNSFFSKLKKFLFSG